MRSRMACVLALAALMCGSSPAPPEPARADDAPLEDEVGQVAEKLAMALKVRGKPVAFLGRFSCLRGSDRTRDPGWGSRWRTTSAGAGSRWSRPRRC